tara:strand:- start:148 stop:387 length:240 start_codon:yes stop_codon:yes gene_type:complete
LQHKIGRETQKLTNDLIDIFKLIFVAIILIVVLFIAIKQLVGDVPAYVGSVIVGLGGVFLYATNKKVRVHMKNWLSGKK